MKRTYFEIAERVWKILAHILAFMLMALIAIVFWQIFCRYVIKASNGWTQEISTLVFIWATYLGAALAIRSGAQISVRVIVNKFKEPLHEIIVLIAAVICEVFYFVFTIAGILAMHIFVGVGTPALRMSMAIPYSAIAISGVIMIFFGIDEIIKPVKNLISNRKSKEV